MGGHQGRGSNDGRRAWVSELLQVPVLARFAFLPVPDRNFENRNVQEGVYGTRFFRVVTYPDSQSFLMMWGAGQRLSLLRRDGREEVIRRVVDGIFISG